MPNANHVHIYKKPLCINRHMIYDTSSNIILICMLMF